MPQLVSDRYQLKGIELSAIWIWQFLFYWQWNTVRCSITFYRSDLETSLFTFNFGFEKKQPIFTHYLGEPKETDLDDDYPF